MFCLRPPDDDPYFEYLSHYHPVLFVVKMIQFIVIRYAELHSDSRLDDNLVKIYYQLCNTSDRQLVSSERPRWAVLLGYY